MPEIKRKTKNITQGNILHYIPNISNLFKTSSDSWVEQTKKHNKLRYLMKIQKNPGKTGKNPEKTETGKISGKENNHIICEQ